MLYADDAAIVSRPSEGLERMMTVIVTACSAFGLTVSEGENRCYVPANQSPGEGVVHNQCSRPVMQTRIECVYLTGLSPQTETLAFK